MPDSSDTTDGEADGGRWAAAVPAEWCAVAVRGGKRVTPSRFWSVHIVRWRAVTLPRHKGRLVPHIHHHHLPLLFLLLLPSSSSSLENDTFHGTFTYFSRIYGGWTRVSTLPDNWPSMLQFRVVIPRYRKKYILSRPPARSRVLAI